MKTNGFLNKSVVTTTKPPQKQSKQLMDYNHEYKLFNVFN